LSGAGAVHHINSDILRRSNSGRFSGPLGDTMQAVGFSCLIWALRGSHTRNKLADFGGEIIPAPREYDGGFEHLACDIATPIRSFPDGRDCLRDLSRTVCH
jgi:hypothetical protein